MRRFAAGVGGDLTPIFFASARPSLFDGVLARLPRPLLLPSHLVRFRVSVHVPHPGAYVPAGRTSSNAVNRCCSSKHNMSTAKHAANRAPSPPTRSARRAFTSESSASLRLADRRNACTRSNASPSCARHIARSRARLSRRGGDHAGRRDPTPAGPDERPRRETSPPRRSPCRRENPTAIARRRSLPSRGCADLAATLSISAVSSAESYASSDVVVVVRVVRVRVARAELPRGHRRGRRARNDTTTVRVLRRIASGGVTSRPPQPIPPQSPSPSPRANRRRRGASTEQRLGRRVRSDGVSRGRTRQPATPRRPLERPPRRPA